MSLGVITVLINRTPKVMLNSIDFYKDLIQVPSIA
jgi:hypothetical protein